MSYRGVGGAVMSYRGVGGAVMSYREWEEQ